MTASPRSKGERPYLRPNKLGTRKRLNLEVAVLSILLFSAGYFEDPPPPPPPAESMNDVFGFFDFKLINLFAELLRSPIVVFCS